MHARFRSPLTSRFLSTDPVMNLKRALRKPQNWNRYAYGLGNPLKYVDPTGEDVSIKISFASNANLTDEQKAAILSKVQNWYTQQNVGKVFVFDGAKASHGPILATNGGGYASIKVLGGSSLKNTDTKVYAGSFSGLSSEQQSNAISNSIIHETAAHQFQATYANRGDALAFMRGGLFSADPGIQSRYGTVADSDAFGDASTRSNVTDGPIPIHPGDRTELQRILGPLHVEEPDYE